MPWFLQGLDAHSLMSSSQRWPEKPGLQKQLHRDDKSRIGLQLRKKITCLSGIMQPKCDFILQELQDMKIIHCYFNGC